MCSCRIQDVSRGQREDTVSRRDTSSGTAVCGNLGHLLSAIINFLLAKGKVIDLCISGNWWKFIRWKNKSQNKHCWICWMRIWSVPEPGTSSIFDHLNSKATVNEANEKLNVTCIKMIRIKLCSWKVTASEMNSLNVLRKSGGVGNVIYCSDICFAFIDWTPCTLAGQIREYLSRKPGVTSSIRLRHLYFGYLNGLNSVTLTSKAVWDVLEHPNHLHRAGRWDTQPTDDLHLSGQTASCQDERVRASPVTLDHSI